MNTKLKFRLQPYKNQHGNWYNLLEMYKGHWVTIRGGLSRQQVLAEIDYRLRGFPA